MALGFILLVVTTLLLPSTLASTELHNACAQGPTSTLISLLSTSANPYALLSSTTPERETCLHLLGIEADPPRLSALTSYITPHESSAGTAAAASLYNARVATPTGLDMPPVSWFVFGGHVSAVRHLLGQPLASPNVVFRNEQGGKITILDVAAGIFESVHGGAHRLMREEEKLALREGGDKWLLMVELIEEWGGVVADEARLGLGRDPMEL